MSLTPLSYRTPPLPQRTHSTVRAQVIFGASIILVLIWFNFVNPYERPSETRLLATAVVLLGIFPIYRWVGDPSRDAIPVFSMHAAFYALTYGVVGLMEPGRMFGLNWVSEDERQTALLITLFGLAFLYFGYYIIGSLIAKRNNIETWPLRVRPAYYSGLVLVAFPILVITEILFQYFDLTLFSQVVTAIYNFLFVLIIYAAFSGAFKKRPRQYVFFILIPYQLIFGSGLANSTTFGFIFWATVIGLTYFSSRRSLPYLWIVLAIVIFTLIQPVKKEFRILTWNEESGTSSSIEKLLLFGALTKLYYFDSVSTVNDYNDEIRTSTFDRLNNLNTLAAIIVDTPQSRPYLYGETYVPLLTKIVPRFLWPDKPEEDLGNKWATRYGYLDQYDNKTSFNLPWLPEMYMNFGIFGVASINFFLGILFVVLSNLFWKKVADPSVFAFGMVLGMPLFFVESNLSLVLGSLITQAVSLFFLGYFATMLFPRLFFWRRRTK